MTRQKRQDVLAGIVRDIERAMGALDVAVFDSLLNTDYVCWETARESTEIVSKVIHAQNEIMGALEAYVAFCEDLTYMEVQK